jgi:hypothetical protein
LNNLKREFYGSLLTQLIVLKANVPISVSLSADHGGKRLIRWKTEHYRILGTCQGTAVIVAKTRTTMLYGAATISCNY